MKIDDTARYSETHEWVRKEENLFTYGITDHAQDQLSDIVFIELPDVGSRFEKEDIIGVVESVKAASDLCLPISGEIIEINEDLIDSPESINVDPYGAGWMVKFRADDPSQWNELLTPVDYEAYLGEK